ncbi:methyltransferase [Actinopolymorpha sp. B11F2]|uniref:methyltransferase n=1 Tax=Actinopolymorpha sp. B11F2 TaxID=3160862 RepID=UPI0032E4A531
MKLVVTFLPGLASFVRSELEELGSVTRLRLEDGRSEISFTYGGSLRRLFDLRTVLAAYLVLCFPVPRPRSLLSSEYLPTIADGIARVRSLNRSLPPRGIRIGAAGADSAVFARIARELESLTGLPRDQDEGNCHLRFRPSRARGGWEVLVRLSTRPLSLREWRTAPYPGGLNATIAAAMVRWTRPDPRDRFLNLMCGSGTLLVERLLMAPVRRAVGVDHSDEAIAASAENLRSAGLAGRAELISSDIRVGGSLDGVGTFDLLVADPPWGDKHGSHRENRELYNALLRRSAELATERATMIVATQELRLMDALVSASPDWRGDERIQVFAKGHRPCLYLLRRTP